MKGARFAIQIMVYALIAYRDIWASMYNLAVIFFALTPDHYCVVPELKAANWTREQIMNIRLKGQFRLLASGPTS